MEDQAPTRCVPNPQRAAERFPVRATGHVGHEHDAIGDGLGAHVMGRGAFAGVGGEGRNNLRPFPDSARRPELAKRRMQEPLDRSAIAADVGLEQQELVVDDHAEVFVRPIVRGSSHSPMLSPPPDGGFTNSSHSGPTIWL
jgi:hypothetical protein